jgi:hypothetical protein
VAETARYSEAHRAIVQAIVHLNFNDRDKALEVLLDALSDSNSKENSIGNRIAAA